MDDSSSLVITVIYCYYLILFLIPPFLCKRLLQPYNLSSKDAILWGITNEAVARDKYCTYGDAVVEETGLWLHPNGVLGASPDGIIHRAATHHHNHQLAPLTDELEALKPDILDIKCPFSCRELTITEAIVTQKEIYLEYQTNNGRQLFELKEDHPYYDQIQGQLHVLNKSACDSVVWTPKDVAIIRIVQDNTWAENITKLTEFYFKRLIHVIQQ